MKHVFLFTLFLVADFISPNEVSAATWSKEAIESYRGKLIYVYVNRDLNSPYFGYVYWTGDEYFTLHRKGGNQYANISYSQIYTVRIAGSGRNSISSETANQIVLYTILIVAAIYAIIQLAVL